MRFLLHFTAAAMLAAIVIGGTNSVAAADREAQAQIMGRQKIRTELAAALEKGYLTRMDQYHLLLDAKEVLTADDLHGFEQTLNRIATQQAKSRAAAQQGTRRLPDVKVVRNKAADDLQAPNPENPGTVRPSNYEERPVAPDMPVIADPAPKNRHAPSNGTAMEEVPAGIGKPAIHLDNTVPEGPEPSTEGCGCAPNGGDCDPESCDCCPGCCRYWHRWLDLDFFSSVDAFKGPVDLGNSNGNFGLGSGVNAAVPVVARMGIALQAGVSDVVSNLKGSPLPEPDAECRNQVFATVGMFQRLGCDERAFTWGFAYDWLFDRYYVDFHLGQWRAKAAYTFDSGNEVGVQASVPEHGSSGTILTFIGTTEEVRIKPISQGYVYWTHTWCNEASLTGRFGVAERPGEFVFGAEGRVPLNRYMALTSDISYILPNASGGPVGQTEEIWNVSVGIEIVPGGFNHGCPCRFRPFLPVADNGSLAGRLLGE